MLGGNAAHELNSGYGIQEFFKMFNFDKCFRVKKFNLFLHERVKSIKGISVRF